MNKILHAIIFTVFILTVYSQEPPQLLNEINDPNQIIHSLNETSIDTSLLDQVKNLNVAKEDPADAVDDVPATDGTLIDNTDDFKTTDYLDPSGDVEAHEPLVYSSEEDNEIQQYRSHIATDNGGNDVNQLYESSIKHAPEEGEDSQLTQAYQSPIAAPREDDVNQLYESSVKHAPEEGEDGQLTQAYQSPIATPREDNISQIYESSVNHAPEESEGDQKVYQSPIAAPHEDDLIQKYESSIKHASEEGEDSQVTQVYQSPIKVGPKEDEADAGNKEGSDITVKTEDGEYTQGQLVDNLDDFRTIDTLDANDPDVINNAEEKLEEAEVTPGIVIPPATHDRADGAEGTSTGELDDKKYETLDVQEKGFLPKN